MGFVEIIQTIKTNNVSFLNLTIKCISRNSLTLLSQF